MNSDITPTMARVMSRLTDGVMMVVRRWHPIRTMEALEKRGFLVLGVSGMGSLGEEDKRSYRLTQYGRGFIAGMHCRRRKQKTSRLLSRNKVKWPKAKGK